MPCAVPIPLVIWRSPNMRLQTSHRKAPNITLGPAQGTTPTMGRNAWPCKRTRGTAPLSDANDDPTVVGNMQLQEKVHALGRLACRLPWHYTPLPSEGGAGGGSLGLGVVLWGWASKCKEGSRSAWPWEPSVVERGRLPTLPHCIAVPSA